MAKFFNSKFGKTLFFGTSGNDPKFRKGEKIFNRKAAALRANTTDFNRQTLLSDPSSVSTILGSG